MYSSSLFPSMCVQHTILPPVSSKWVYTLTLILLTSLKRINCSVLRLKRIHIHFVHLRTLGHLILISRIGYAGSTHHLIICIILPHAHLGIHPGTHIVIRCQLMMALVQTYTRAWLCLALGHLLLLNRLGIWIIRVVHVWGHDHRIRWPCI